MNEFDIEPESAEFETTASETTESETDAEVVASGLLPGEAYRPGARLEVVEDSTETCETRRLYREIPIRIDDSRSVLLVGPWCEIESRRVYRVRKSDSRPQRYASEFESESLLTVEILAEGDEPPHSRRL